MADGSAAKPALDFTEDKSAEKLYKDSLFQNVFSQKKALLEGYPSLKKGLQLPEPTLVYGGATYSFKTTEVVDKVTAKGNGHAFEARYKKQTAKYDVSVKGQCMKDLAWKLKYENRTDTQPTFVLGMGYTLPALAMHAKYNPTTANFKASALYNLNDVVAGVKVAADLKMTNFAVGEAAYNVGAQYNSAAGICSVGFNNKNKVTIAHHIELDKATSAACQLSHDVTKGGTPNLTAAVGYKVDKQHQVRVRVNSNAQVNACLKKELCPGTNLLVGSTCNLAQGAAAFSQAPSLSFKVAIDPSYQAK